jgi:hypothetical protein
MSAYQYRATFEGLRASAAIGFLKREALVRFLAAAILLALAPAHAFALSLYTNSYGWDKIYRYDTSAGTMSLITPTDTLSTGFCAHSDFGPDGFLYGGSAYNLYRINLSGPQAVWSQYLHLSQQANNGLAFAPNGTMYLTSNSGLAQSLWAIDSGGNTIPGSAVTVTYGGSVVFLGGIDFAPNGTLYASDYSHIYTINLATGAATLLHSVSGSSNGGLYDLDYGPDGILRALTSYDYIYGYNPSTGVGGWQTGKLLYNGSSFSPIGLASPPAVPEPSAMALAAAFAIVSVAAHLRKTRKKEH